MWSREKILELSYDHPLLLFDGDCILCNTTVRKIVQVDREEVFRFLAIQEFAQFLAEAKDIDSVLLVKHGAIYSESDAVIEAAELLPYPYRLIYYLRWVPEAIRDYFYRLIAKYRYRIFGKEDQCYLHNKPVQDRLITLN